MSEILVMNALYTYIAWNLIFFTYAFFVLSRKPDTYKLNKIEKIIVLPYSIFDKII